MAQLLKRQPALATLVLTNKRRYRLGRCPAKLSIRPPKYLLHFEHNDLIRESILDLFKNPAANRLCEPA